MNQTPNFQLNQWEADDQVQRTDFNADNAKIDEALTALDVKADGKAAQTALNALISRVASLERERFYVGTYTGDGAETRTISLPWTPAFVILCGPHRAENSIALLTPGHRAYFTKDAVVPDLLLLPEIRGASLYFPNNWSNTNGKNGWYILFR